MKDLWEGVSLEIYNKNTFSQVFFNDFFANKKVLVISYRSAFMDTLDHMYGNYLLELYKKYYDNFDEIIIVNSLQKINVLSFNSYFPDLPCAYDNGEFISVLKKIFNNTADINILKKIWKYQIIFDNKEIKFFTDYNFNRDKNEIIRTQLKKHSVDERDESFNDMIRALKYMSLDSINILSGRSPSSMFNNLKDDVAIDIFYHNLWPSRIEEYLT